jgi:hypothetical protein
MNGVKAGAPVGARSTLQPTARTTKRFRRSPRESFGDVDRLARARTLREMANSLTARRREQM